MMKMAWILVTATLSFSSAQALSAPCARCEAIQKLEKEFLALQFEKKSDRKIGYAKMEKVLAQLNRFHTAGEKNPAREAEFEALVNLVAASLPYDMETEGPESLTSLIIHSNKLGHAFDTTLNSMTDSCRQQLMQQVFGERICYARLEEKGLEDKNGSCIRASFSYPKCIGLTEDLTK